MNLKYVNTTFAGEALRCLLQPLPTGDVTVVMKVTYNVPTSQSVEGGIMLSTSAASGSGTQRSYQLSLSTGTKAYGWWNWTTFSAFVSVTGYTTFADANVSLTRFLRAYRSGSTWVGSFSSDGVTWTGSVVLGTFAATHFGLYFQNTGNNQTGQVNVDFVRAFNGADVTAIGGNQISNFVADETPGGAVNGSNTVFTLANTPISGKLAIYMGATASALNRAKSSAFALTGNTITFTVAPPGGYLLAADYYY